MKLEIKPAAKRSVLALLLLAGLAACGGGGGGGQSQSAAQDPDSVPASAVASVPAFVNYLNTTPSNDTGESLTVGDVSLPTTDSEEPIDV